MKKRQGISLIVLVITVIIMIILAAAIIISLNNSGIIGKAQDAADKTSRANEEEELQVLFGEVLLAKYTNAGKRDVGDYLSTGWSGENGKYYSPSGDIYEEVNGKMVNTGAKGAFEGSDTELYVRNITSQQDMLNALNNGNLWNSQIWNIQSDITLNSTVAMNLYRATTLIINGNGHTISGSDDTDSSFAKQMFKFALYEEGSSVIFNDINLVSGYHFRHALEVGSYGGATNYMRLNNVTIDHSKGTSQNDKYGAAIINNSSEVKIQNNFSLISGPRAWAAIDLDNTHGNVKLTFASNAKVTLTDNRSSEKKASEPFIGFSRESETNAITLTNLSSYTFNHVIKDSSSKEGYDI